MASNASVGELSLVIQILSRIERKDIEDNPEKYAQLTDLMRGLLGQSSIYTPTRNINRTTQHTESKKQLQQESKDIPEPPQPPPLQPEPPVKNDCPSFFASILHLGKFRRILPNTPRPIPFKTSLFEGQALLLVRSPTLDTQRYAHRFNGNHYTFEIQIQGKFLMVPAGRLFIGAEVTKPMSLGLLTKGMCRAILQLGRTVNKHLHHSFGSSQPGRSETELPHIVGPMWSAADKLVITRPSSKPPALGDSFPEDPVRRSTRRSDADFTHDVSLDNTYSISFKTSNIDLVSWTAANLPLVNSIDLHTFWSDADLRAVCYCVDGASVSTGRSSMTPTHTHSSSPLHHYQQQITYMFSVQFQHESNLDEEDRNLTPICEAATDSRAEVEARESHDECTGRARSQSAQSGLHDRRYSLSMLSEDGEGCMFFDAHDEEDIGGALQGLTNLPATPMIPTSYQKPNRAPYTGFQSGRFPYTLPYDASSHTHSSTSHYVLAAIEVDELRLVRQSVLQKGRRTLYAIRISKEIAMTSTTTSTSSTASTSADTSPFALLRTYNEWSSHYPIFKRSKRPCDRRLSDIEKRRLDLDASLFVAFRDTKGDQTARAELLSFLSSSEHVDALLEVTPGAGLGVSAKRLRQDLHFRLESLVLVQQGQHYWSEEYMGLSSSQLVFIKPPSRLGLASRLSIDLHCILSVSSIDDSDLPFLLPDCSGLLVATMGRCYVILMKGASFRNAWVNTLDIAVAGYDSNATATNAANPGRSASLDLFIKPRGWKASVPSRLVLNARLYRVAMTALRPHDPSLELLWEYRRQGHILVARLLRMGLELLSAEGKESGDGKDIRDGGRFVAFMNGVSLLQDLPPPVVSTDLCLATHNTPIPPPPYTGTDSTTIPFTVCLLLNLYHCLLVHSYIVLGVPLTQRKWTEMYSTCAYEALGDIFTLEELQQKCILYGVSGLGLMKGHKDMDGSTSKNKNKSSTGSTTSAISAASHAPYSFSLECRDPRLLWATLSGPRDFTIGGNGVESIIVYEPQSLDQQLEEAVQGGMAR